MDKVALLIAYHYPPLSSSSGQQRTLAFSRYLPEHGWKPIVLTVKPGVYEKTSDDQLADIPVSTEVVRTWCLDVARHLSVGGKYFDWMALPDRWNTWFISSLVTGLYLVRKHQPSILWVTYPIATTHLIGLALHKMTGIPLIADYRDSMTEDDYPTEPHRWRCYRRLEAAVLKQCARAVFTTPGTAKMYAERYPEIPPDVFQIIPNGYDENSFSRAGDPPSSSGTRDSKLTLLHSGLLYPDVRNPNSFFKALRILKERGVASSNDLHVILRATGDDDIYCAWLKKHSVEDMVSLCPPLPYTQALREMLDADGLLIFQGADCNYQIPAKLYEYIRARRPLLALTDPSGDTASTLRDMGYNSIVPMDDPDAIVSELTAFLGELRESTAFVPSIDDVSQHTRQQRTRQLAELFDNVLETRRFR
jgi:glycosyltransferase involved in cell wall biosynthesis